MTSADNSLSPNLMMPPSTIEEWSKISSKKEVTNSIDGRAYLSCAMSSSKGLHFVTMMQLSTMYKSHLFNSSSGKIYNSRSISQHLALSESSCQQTKLCFRPVHSVYSRTGV